MGLRMLIVVFTIYSSFKICDFTETSDGYVFASDGDVVECVDMKKQRAFGNPLLKNHKIQELPSEFPRMMETIRKSKWQMREANVSIATCPQGTIPVRRDGVSLNRQTQPQPATTAPVHEYAVIAPRTPSKLCGAKATVNMWDPAIEEGADEMSISQIWVSSGKYKTNDVNTIEIGWQPDTYAHGCYNLRCAGFIQTSSSVVLGGSITPISSFGGNQYELTILVWKDQKEGNWWLSLGPDKNIVGYWPAELFTILFEHADAVEFGGEILNSHTFDRHTTTQIGSGHFPDEGFRKTSYFRNIEFVDNNNSLRPIQDLKKKVTNPKWYDITNRFTDDWGVHVFYGGSGIMPSRAVSS